MQAQGVLRHLNTIIERLYDTFIKDFGFDPVISQYRLWMLTLNDYRDNCVCMLLSRPKEVAMRNREKQRKLRQSKEKRLETHDFCGIFDPTPYAAVMNIIRNQRAETNNGSKIGNRCRSL